MRVIANNILKKYWDKHANCRKELEEWHGIAQNSSWASPHDVKRIYPKASIMANNRVVFNIVGANFRLIVKFAYKTKIGYIRFIGTHKEHDQVDAETI